MRLQHAPEPVTDDDDTIRAAVTDAPLPPLLAAVAALTGDHTILRADLRPDLARVLEPNIGYSDEQVATAQRLAADALIRFRDSGSKPAPPLDEVQLRSLVEFVAGGPVDDEYLPLLEEELALDGDDRRAPRWRKDTIAPDVGFTVGVIGAGMSGLAAAHRLQQAGVSVVVFEKNADVGGTWFENAYPGCRVDIQNHFYSYSFAQTSDWPQFHSQQKVLLDYFRLCADEFDLRALISFDTEVLAARWSDDDQQWHLDVRGPDGRTESHLVHALVSATGQLNRPLMPDIPGIERFQGPWFHSARWDHTVDLEGSRVAVIGTGASAVQFIPIVAEQAAHLTVWQRTPPWLLPVPLYQHDLPAGLRWLLRHVPDYARWDRLWIFAVTQEGLLPLAIVDPEWQPQARSVSALNEMMRSNLETFYESAFPDPDLRAKVLPSYPPISKRLVLEDGTYAATLHRDDVTLDTTAIAEITERGVRDVNGVEHEYDVIIYGTGFQASKFLTPMCVTGVAGVDLHEQWGGDARAYLGITIPEYPNLFLMYGPNTNIVINGSIIYFSECEAHYIVESVRMLLEHDKRSMDCRPAVHDDYNERIDAANRARAWGASDVNSWYKNEFGRVAQNWPFNLFEYWKQTRTPDPDDYVLR
jgi:4-hydroxyacetophenone monooxygenase